MSGNYINIYGRPGIQQPSEGGLDLEQLAAVRSQRPSIATPLQTTTTANPSINAFRNQAQTSGLISGRPRIGALNFEEQPEVTEMREEEFGLPSRSNNQPNTNMSAADKAELRRAFNLSSSNRRGFNPEMEGTEELPFARRRAALNLNPGQRLREEVSRETERQKFGPSLEETSPIPPRIGRRASQGELQNLAIPREGLPSTRSQFQRMLQQEPLQVQPPSRQGVPPKQSEFQRMLQEEPGQAQPIPEGRAPQGQSRFEKLVNEASGVSQGYNAPHARGMAGTSGNRNVGIEGFENIPGEQQFLWPRGITRQPGGGGGGPETSYAGVPGWMGGEYGAARESIDRNSIATDVPYRKYKGERVAGFQPIQNEAKNYLEREVNEPQYNEMFQTSGGAVRNALGRNVLPEIQGYLQRSVENPAANAQLYMNPYNQAVTENIGKLASRNLLENILPGVNDRFIRAGAFGSAGGRGSHQNLTRQSIRDTQEDVTRKQLEALRHGYEQALNTSVAQQGRNIQAGELAGNIGIRDIERGITGGRTLQDIAIAEQAGRRARIAPIADIGTQQQAQEQHKRNVAYKDFLEQREHPREMAAQFSNAVRGHNIAQSSQAAQPYIPPPPQPSAWTQASGLLGALTGASQMRGGFSHGGYVHNDVDNNFPPSPYVYNRPRPPSIAHLRHYADGGSVGMSPIQKGINDAFDTSEIQKMRNQAQKLESMQVDPFWSAVTKASLDFGSRPQTQGFLGSLVEGAKTGLGEYENQMANQEAREMQATKIHGLIDSTRRDQEERDRKHSLALEKFEQDKKEFGMSHEINAGNLGLHREQFGLNKRKFEKEEENADLIEGPGKQLYRMERDESGLPHLTHIEGMEEQPIKTKAEIQQIRKSNEEDIKKWEKILDTSNERRSVLNNLHEENEKLKTPGWESGITNIYKPAGDFSKSIRAGREDIDKMTADSERLAALKIATLTGKGNTVAHQQSIKASKMKPDYSYEANKSIYDLENNSLNYDEGEAKFGIDMSKKYNNNIPTSQIKRAYKEYYDIKKKWELKAENKNKKFDQTPEDYLKMVEYEAAGNIVEPETETQMSNAEIRSHFNLGG